MPSAKRAVRVAGASGGFADRQRAIHDLAKYSEVDVIIGGKFCRLVHLERSHKI
jgi:hypothetical protein